MKSLLTFTTIFFLSLNTFAAAKFVVCRAKDLFNPVGGSARATTQMDPLKIILKKSEGAKTILDERTLCGKDVSRLENQLNCSLTDLQEGGLWQKNLNCELGSGPQAEWYANADLLIRERDGQVSGKLSCNMASGLKMRLEFTNCYWTDEP